MEETTLTMQEASVPEEAAAEENTEAVQSRDNAGTEAAKPSESGGKPAETAEDSFVGEAEAAEKEADAEENPGEDTDTQQPREETLVRVKFNKQERAYTTEEAAPLVEMGLKWDSFKENHEKLKFLALSHGKSVGELIELLMNSNDKLLYQQTLTECGGNEAAAVYSSQTCSGECAFFS